MGGKNGGQLGWCKISFLLLNLSETEAGNPPIILLEHRAPSTGISILEGHTRVHTHTHPPTHTYIEIPSSRARGVISEGRISDITNSSWSKWLEKEGYIEGVVVCIPGLMYYCDLGVINQTPKNTHAHETFHTHWVWVKVRRGQGDYCNCDSQKSATNCNSCWRGIIFKSTLCVDIITASRWGKLCQLMPGIQPFFHICCHLLVKPL